MGTTATTASLLGTAETTAGTPGRDAAGKEREVLVGVANGRDAVETVAPGVPADAEIVHENPSLRYVAVRFASKAPDAARERFVERIQERPGVAYAEENGTAELAFAPDDPQYVDQHVPQDVGAETAWDTTLGTGNVTVAVVDQGVQYDHPDLDGNVETSVANHGRDFVDDDSDPYPADPSSEFHGTYTAGVIAAETDNATGIAGLSEASLLSARTFDESGRGYTSDVADAIQWAADQGADVINLSLTSSEKQVLKDALAYAADRGALPIAAAGNDYGGVVDYPAAHEDCLAVSGYDSSSGSLLATTNYGPEIELTAPGNDVLSTTTTDRGDYATRSGSSVATAVVSGVAALALAEHDLTNDQLRNHLKRTAVDVGLPADEQGAGRVDAAGAVVEPPLRVVDDFEDGYLVGYDFDQGESGASVVSGESLTGSHALEIADTSTQMISTERLGTYPSIGDTFRCAVRATGGTTDVSVTYGVQDHRNRYYVRVDFGSDNIRLYRYQDDSPTLLERDDDSATLNQDEWYELEVDWAVDGTHTATLYDSNGSAVAQASGTDATWTHGGVGYSAYLASGEAVYFDSMTVEATDRVVDDFEVGDLNEYEFDRGASGASVVSSPTYDGSRALALSNEHTELISTSGLDVYPTAGDTLRYRVRATGGASVANVTYGVQDHRNRYFVQLNFQDDTVRLYRYQDDGSNVLARADTGFTFREDEWYEVEIDWGENGGHRVRLIDASGTTVAKVTASDLTWTTGGVGYDAYLAASGGTVYFDAVEVDVGDGSEAGVIDSFENGDLDAYTVHGNPDSTSVAVGPSTTPFNSLELTADDTELISTSGLDAYPQAGDTIYYNVLGTNSADDVNLSYGVQDHQNRYYVRVDMITDNNIRLLRYENGDSTLLDRDADDVSINHDEWHELEVDWGTDGTHVVTLRDSEGTEVAQVSATDDTWTDGGVGYDAYLSDDGGSAFVDDVSLVRSDGTTATVDDFADGDLDDYDFDQGESGGSVNTEAVLYGTRMLKFADADTGVHSTTGLPVYPETGDTFTYRVRGEDGGQTLSLDYGVQDEGSEYRVKVDLGSNELHLIVAEDGTETVLDSVTDGFTLTQGSWNEVTVDWGADGTHTVTLYDPGANQLAQVSATDATYEHGGIGYDAELTSDRQAYVDFVTLE